MSSTLTAQCQHSTVVIESREDLAAHPSRRGFKAPCGCTFLFSAEEVATLPETEVVEVEPNRLSTATTAEIKEAYLACLGAIDTPNARARAAKASKARRLLADLYGADFQPHRDLAAYARDLDSLAYPEA